MKKTKNSQKRRRNNVEAELITEGFVPSQGGKTYLKKVIAENFLTFERDEADFEDAKFTIVVGPNWSGKTTIFQAIKFGLGSNERDTRYTNWSDFIRHHKNHAMVELHIIHENKLIKLRRTVIRGNSPYFSIQRKGDSDFKRINADEVRELIDQLKINPDNEFAFVSQGNIDGIKNLKPEQVNEYIEEGIGLKGLRTEILEQKEKVEQLKHELNSMKTKRNTLNISLELLRPKLERLKEKKVFLNIKQKFEDELLFANQKKVEKEIINLEGKCEKIQQDIERINSEHQGLLEEVEKFQEKITAINKEISTLAEQAGINKHEKKNLEEKIRRWHDEKQEMKEELQKIKKKIDNANKIKQNYESQKRSVNSQLKIIHDNKSKLEANIDDLFKEQEELEEKIKKHGKFFEEYNKFVSLRTEKQDIITKHQKTIKEINSEIKQVFTSLDEIDHKLEKNRWFLEDPTPNLLKKLEIDRKKAKDRLHDLEKEVQELDYEKNKKIRRIKSLRGSLRDRTIPLPSEINVLKQEIENRELKAKGPIIDFLKYDDELSYAIESVLGERLLYSFIAEDWDTLDLLKRLKKKYHAYCNIYVPKKINIQSLVKIKAPGALGYLAELIQVIGNDMDIKKVIYSKIKNCLVVKDYRAGKEIYNKLNFGGKCVTLKGEQLVSYKYAYEAPFTKRLKGLLSAGTQKEQSSVLEEEVKQINENLADLRITQSKLDQSVRDLHNRSEAFYGLQFHFKDKQRLTSKKNDLYDERKTYHDEIERLEKDINEFNKKIEQLESQKHPQFFSWNDRIKEIPNELKDINAKKKQWDSKFDETLENLNEIKENLNKHNLSLNSIQTEYKTKEKNFKEADKEAFNIFRELNDIEGELSKIKENISELEQERQNIEGEKRDVDKKSMHLKLLLEQENTKLSINLQEIKTKKEDLSRINTLLEDKEETEIRPIEEIKADITETEKELLKYYDVDDSLLVEKEELMAGLKRIAQNQKELEDEINAAMKTEHKMETTYYSKYEKVLGTLETKINQKFKNSGIRQYCSLSLMGDFKSLGVDIKAAISKKLVRQCSALSGGQRSMIAISLILSLQEIRPSPLCLLDEPAMFLDGRNSEVAYKLMKTTLDVNNNQMVAFLPESPSPLFKLADKLIGVARPEDKDVSHVFKEPKLDFEEDE